MAAAVLDAKQVPVDGLMVHCPVAAYISPVATLCRKACVSAVLCTGLPVGLYDPVYIGASRTYHRPDGSYLSNSDTTVC